MTAYYKLDHSEPGYLSKMLPRADGAWVKRADYEADLAAARTEIERLKGKLQARDGECKGKAEIIAQLEAERDKARAENERLNNALTEAANQISDLASRLGQAEGRLVASELVGIVEGWKARAEKAEAERDEALAQVKHMEGFDHCTCGPCPIHQDAALEAYGREKAREGMRRAAEIIRGCCPECRGTGLRDSGGVQPWGEPISVPCDCTDAILAEMEKEGGK